MKRESILLRKVVKEVNEVETAVMGKDKIDKYKMKHNTAYRDVVTKYFLTDRTYRDVVIVALLNVGRYISGLDYSFRSSHNGVDWNKFIEVRNVIITDLETLENETIIDMVFNRLLEVRTYIISILGEVDGEEE